MSAIVSPSPSTWRRTAGAVAPSASLSPISRVRRPTMNATTPYKPIPESGNRREREEEHEQQREATARNRIREQLVERRNIGNRLFRVQRADDFTRGGRNGQWIAVDAHRDRTGDIRRHLRVPDAWGDGASPRVMHVAGYADDGDGWVVARRRTPRELLSDGIASRPRLRGKRATDDRNPRRALTIGIGTCVRTRAECQRPRSSLR